MLSKSTTKLMFVIPILGIVFLACLYFVLLATAATQEQTETASAIEPDRKSYLKIVEPAVIEPLTTNPANFGRENPFLPY